MEMNQAAQNFVACLDELDSKYAEFEADLYQQTPPTGYWLSMIAGVAVEKSNRTVDHNPKYASADHGANFQCLLACIRKSIKNDDPFVRPYFDGVLAPDGLAQSALGYESARIYVRHMRASILMGLWSVEEPTSRQFKISLTPKHQRSALHLLSVKAQFLKSSKPTKKILAGKNAIDSSGSKLILTMRLDELAALTLGVEKEWQEFLFAIGLTEASLVHFLAMVSDINSKTYRLWFTEGDLIEYMEAFEKTNRLPRSDKNCIANVISKCSANLQDAVAWGLSVPFVKFGGWYLRWPFAFHVLHPGLTALAILMKGAQKEWDNTVGAQSAKVAHYVAAQLNNPSSVLSKVCRVKKGVGDVDIGILNLNTGDIILCEVKTVFDRFRTNHQLSNFVEQRVNYEKAMRQLRVTETAILDGHWKIGDIFETKAVIPPSGKIFKVVLTWWDIFDPFKGTADADIATANFDTFIYLYNQAAGDLAAVFKSLLELSALPCPAYPREDYTEIDQLRFDYSIDAQTDILPPRDDPRRQILSPLSAKVIQDMASMPDDWREQALNTGTDPRKWVFA